MAFFIILKCGRIIYERGRNPRIQLDSKIGAVIYNIGHSFILPILMLLLYVFFLNDALLMIALIWFAHIFMDRLFGFGLKYQNDFKETHIQKISDF
ncbi:DUF4260 family protein [Peribacillus faecalis]|uniref:DUF4260 family protein n=1 Tax=Peribacillus faecalis TaxID=2772559 RepID=UPI0019D6E361|nr:DUF4260 family protein [Peribacillus faecalis]